MILVFQWINFFYFFYLKIDNSIFGQRKGELNYQHPAVIDRPVMQ